MKQIPAAAIFLRRFGLSFVVSNGAVITLTRSGSVASFGKTGRARLDRAVRLVAGGGFVVVLGDVELGDGFFPCKICFLALSLIRYASRETAAAMDPCSVSGMSGS